MGYHDNPGHKAIAKLAERTHGERITGFQREILRGGYAPGTLGSGNPPDERPRRDAAADVDLELAFKAYDARQYEDVAAFADYVLRSQNATAEQRAEAMRLRAAAAGDEGRLEEAIEEAERALALDPDGSGSLPALHLRYLLGGWRRRSGGSYRGSLLG